MAAGASSASAAYIHPSANFTFGSAGTASSSFEGVNQLAFNQANQRLYVATTTGKIFAFGYTGPGSLTPLAGFPKSVPPGGIPDVAVDNTAGASANQIYYEPDGPTVYGYTPSGAAALPGFPITPNGEVCGIAVDSVGHLWAGNYSHTSAEEFGSGGEALGSVDLTGIGQPCDVEIDRSNDDLYVALYGGGVYRLTAASGYAVGSALKFDDRNDATMAVNALNRTLYVGAEKGVVAYSGSAGNRIEALATGTSSGVTVDDSTDTVFISNPNTGKIEEWRGVAVPDAVTGPPTGNTQVSGTVKAFGGNVTSCYFEYGLAADSYETQVPCSPATPYSGEQAVTANFPELIGDVTYHYRVVAANANGKFVGGDRTITPHNVDGVQTGSATAITRTTALLHGQFEGNGEDTHYYFEYGTTDKYGKTTPAPPGTDAGAVTGPFEGSTEITGLTGGTTYHYRFVARNSRGKSVGADQTFNTQLAVGGVQTLPATDVITTTATLNGSLDPDGLATTYYFQYGRTTAYGQLAPLPPGTSAGSTPGATPVSTPVVELEPGSVYHYRLVAVNATGSTFGNDETLKTHQAPSINAFSTTNLTASTADLRALINPNGEATNYRFEYGSTVNYGSVIPIPDGTLAAGELPQNVVVQVTGLERLEYHFRVVAENKWGTTTTEDQTFSFYPINCPNSQVRQQTGAGYLPDCRAYELVSPEEATTATLSATGPSSPYATSPSRFAFAGTLGTLEGVGEPKGVIEDVYYATRTDTGWTTRYVGVKASESAESGGPPLEQYFTGRPGGTYGSLGLDKFLDWDNGQRGFVCCGAEGSFAPFLWDAFGNSLGRLPTNLGEIPGGTNDITKGGFEGKVKPSPDFSHYFFSSRNVPFAAGGLSVSPGSAYDNDLETGTVTLISKTPQGTDIPHGTAGSKEAIEFPGVSTDGSHIIMSTKAGPKPNENPAEEEPTENPELEHLYMRTGGQSYDISLGQDGTNHPASFQGMTGDGETVYIESYDQLTAEDQDSSLDLYRWQQEGAAASLTLVSQGTSGTGNSDDCTASWVEDCGVEVLPIKEDCELPLCFYPHPTDNSVARDSGDVYFYSPEQLDNGRGVLGDRNLYVYREGRPRFVATFAPDKIVDRVQVSPDGHFAAFLTSQRLTSYDNAGFRQMYLYEALRKAIVCVSCQPDGSPPQYDVRASINGIFMTDRGRVFFDTKDGLVDRDGNGLTDVYEYVGSRPQLITSGTSSEDESRYGKSGLVGVSANGTDVYFITLETLVGQDRNGPFFKFYDARANGGFPFVPKLGPCAAADECHGAGSSAPAPQSSGTSPNLGSGGNFKQAKKKAHRKHRKAKKKKKAAAKKRNGGAKAKQRGAKTGKGGKR